MGGWFSTRRPRRARPRLAPVTRTLLLVFGLVIVLAFLLALGGPLHPLWAWLIAVNAVTLGMYGYDKVIAGTARMRIPERVLLGLALAGGTPAAIAGMLLFRHKTSKSSFLGLFVVVLLIQAVVVVVVLALMGRL